MPDCEHRGCIRIMKGQEIDIPLENTPLFYCPDEEGGQGHPEHVWRLTNTTAQSGFIVGEKEGYTNPAPVNDVDTVTATRYYFDCDTLTYRTEPGAPTQDFKIYRFCRDRKCRPA